MSTVRARVIIDNDFAGDPDDLFQLAHHILSPSVTIPFVIASKLPAGISFGGGRSVDEGVTIAQDLVTLLGSPVNVLAGSEDGYDAERPGELSTAARAIVDEAMRDDDLPLFVAAGGGLTEVAAALRHRPEIADRLTVVWIGGRAYPDAKFVPQSAMPEFNTMVDFAAATAVFASRAALWQVPQDTYSQCIVSWAELDAKVRPLGALGQHLVTGLQRFVGFVETRFHLNLGETFILGDNPLVLLTALQSSFGADPSSSRSEMKARPVLGPDGEYAGTNPDLPQVRVFTTIDTRLMFEDMFAKFAAFARDEKAYDGVH